MLDAWSCGTVVLIVPVDVLVGIKPMIVLTVLTGHSLISIVARLVVLLNILVVVVAEDKSQPFIFNEAKFVHPSKHEVVTVTFETSHPLKSNVVRLEQFANIEVKAVILLDIFHLFKPSNVVILLLL